MADEIVRGKICCTCAVQNIGVEYYSPPHTLKKTIGECNGLLPSSLGGNCKSKTGPEEKSRRCDTMDNFMKSK
jgi:hypothetical protein